MEVRIIPLRFQVSEFLVLLMIETTNSIRFYVQPEIESLRNLPIEASKHEQTEKITNQVRTPNFGG